MANVVLFSYFRSSCSWRVRAALAWKGIDYKLHSINLLKDVAENHSEEYKTTNPLAMVPALNIDGVTLISSVAILEYLEETHQDPPLLPKDPKSRAAVRTIMDAIGAGIQPIQNTAILFHVGSDKAPEWANHFITRGFKGLEKLLERTAGKYCFGDEITMADLYLAPQVANGNRFKVDMSLFPMISAINERLLQVEAFRSSHPFRQPDCPADLKIN